MAKQKSEKAAKVVAPSKAKQKPAVEPELTLASLQIGDKFNYNGKVYEIVAKNNKNSHCETVVGRRSKWITNDTVVTKA